MRAKQVVWCLLLAATAIVSGCDDERNLVGRWDMGRSNFYFRGDGAVFYFSSSKTRYQGRYYYDDSTEPAILRTDLAEVDGGGNPFTLELQVTFLSSDRLQFVSTNNGQRRATLASRMPENLRE